MSKQQTYNNHLLLKNRKLYWAINYHRNTRGKPMDMNKLHFQRAIYKTLQKL